jgi:hypothetical protein
MEWPAFELVCLDDSALRKDVMVGDQLTLDTFLQVHGAQGLRLIVSSIKGTFEELPQ